MYFWKSYLHRQCDYRNPRSLASRFRAKRAALLIPLLADIHARQGQVRILDIGGSRTYWNCLDETVFEQFNLQITIVNLPGGLNETTATPRFTFIEGDGCDLSTLTDNSVDLVHSNSTIEHVGSWQNMQAFARECHRLATRYYVQTPSFSFPIEPHAAFPFFHWLPAQVRVWLCLHFAIGRYPRCTTVTEAMRWVEDSELLTYRMMQELFPDAEIKRERFAGLTKSYIAIKQA